MAIADNFSCLAWTGGGVGEEVRSDENNENTGKEGFPLGSQTARLFPAAKAGKYWNQEKPYYISPIVRVSSSLHATKCNCGRKHTKGTTLHQYTALHYKAPEDDGWKVFFDQVTLLHPSKPRHILVPPTPSLKRCTAHAQGGVRHHSVRNTPVPGVSTRPVG